MLERRTLSVVLGLGLVIPCLTATAAIARIVPALRAVTWILGSIVAAGGFAAAWHFSNEFPASLDGAA